MAYSLLLPILTPNNNLTVNLLILVKVCGSSSVHQINNFRQNDW